MKKGSNVLLCERKTDYEVAVVCPLGRKIEEVVGKSGTYVTGDHGLEPVFLLVVASGRRPEAWRSAMLGCFATS